MIKFITVRIDEKLKKIEKRKKGATSGPPAARASSSRMRASRFRAARPGDAGLPAEPAPATPCQQPAGAPPPWQLAAIH